MRSQSYTRRDRKGNGSSKRRVDHRLEPAVDRSRASLQRGPFADPPGPKWGPILPAIEGIGFVCRGRAETGQCGFELGGWWSIGPFRVRRRYAFWSSVRQPAAARAGYALMPDNPIGETTSDRRAKEVAVPTVCYDRATPGLRSCQHLSRRRCLVLASIDRGEIGGGSRRQLRWFTKPPRTSFAG
ncbi:MAG: hypothetical protein QOF01_3520 [Thermomicrobiales bacterium]|nr:hypothetical protein [Thermomicrobiales bacterium]